ncbi:MAG: hypothetical protein M1830_005513, partial [Pleopsidium flavum]
DLAIHCVTLSRSEGERTMELMKYLIGAIPKSLEAHSKDGWTPLLLAFSLKRSNAAEILIGNGADQMKRDKLGRNIMHLAFAGANGDIQREAMEVKSMLELIDKRFLQKLSVGRCTEGPGALTHLARWSYCMQRCFNKGASPKCEVLQVLLEISNGTDLEIMDGSGHLPLHVVTKASYHELVRCMLERNPTLLYRENATGQTPLELTETMWLHC